MFFHFKQVFFCTNGEDTSVLSILFYKPPPTLFDVNSFWVRDSKGEASQTREFSQAISKFAATTVCGVGQTFESGFEKAHRCIKSCGVFVSIRKLFFVLKYLSLLW